MSVMRLVIWGLMLVLLVGCGTTSFRSMIPPEEFKPNIAPVKKTQKVLVEKPKLVYKYGSFEVEVFEDRQRILGGMVEKPDIAMAIASEYKHVILVDYKKKELIYYRRNSLGVHESVIKYIVVTPSASYLPQAVVRGVVSKIDMAPIWYPTKNLRSKNPSLPDGPIPFGHPQNEMGDVRFEIVWNVPRWGAIRVHGTRGYPINFHEIDTSGCVRLENRSIKHLVELLGPSAVEEEIEVIVFSTFLAE